MLWIISWVIAGVLAALNIAGLATVSWALIFAIAIAPVLLGFAAVIIVFVIGAVCLVTSMIADWTVKTWRKVRA